MKVVFANNYYYLRGGSERVMFDEIESLKYFAHEIIPFSRFSNKNQSTEYDEYFLPVIDYELMHGLSKVLAAMDIVYSKKIKNKFCSLLDQENPSLVHGHNIYSGLTYSIVDAAKARRIPFVITLHDLKLACPSYLMLNQGQICERCGTGKFWNCAVQRCHKESLPASLIITAEAYYNKLLGKYDWISRFICPSRFLLDKVAAAGIPRDKLVYLSNALNPASYKVNYDNCAYAFFAGRLSKEKGVLTLLKAFKDLTIPLRIAGTGPIESECREFVSMHRMNHVTFEGYCQGDKLKNLFRQATFLIIPSECYENAPMSILEAFAYGKPVIGSNIGGIPEQVVQDETGLLFEASNAESLADAVLFLWKDRSKVESMGRAARHRIKTVFSAERHTEKLLEIYHDVTSI
jgi:glycosyltransferase involved in cell wall biosynthesis